MKIVNIDILLTKPSPIFIRLFGIAAIIDSHTNLKAGLFEIGLHENSDCLIFSILHVDLFGYQMKERQLAYFKPFSSTYIQDEALFIFASSDKQDLVDDPISILWT